MNVLLIDVDSKIPNLALMKLSAWHKALGDDIQLGWPGTAARWYPDKVYASSVFTKSRTLRLSVELTFNGVIHPKAVTGGTGWSLQNKLPAEVEAMAPDYDLYGIDYSLGFTSRGCIRKCAFCVVPEKEGRIKSVSDISSFLNPRSRKVTLLDNNFFAQPQWRERVEEIKKHKLVVDFNQGIDIRLMDEEVAEALVAIRPPYIRFAWDHIGLEKCVRRGLKTLAAAGYPITRSRVGCYVLVGFDSSHEEDIYRCNVLHELGVNTHVQVYEKANKVARHVARWGNRPQIWTQIPFEDYRNAQMARIQEAMF